MKPKEKAAELLCELFKRSLAYHDACIAACYMVDEIQKALHTWDIGYESHNSYWSEVKTELENL